MEWKKFAWLRKYGIVKETVNAIQSNFNTLNQKISALNQKIGNLQAQIDGAFICEAGSFKFDSKDGFEVKAPCVYVKDDMKVGGNLEVIGTSISIGNILKIKG